MARLQDFPTVTPTSSDKLLVVQSQSQGLVPYGSKLDSANPTGTGSLSLNRKANTTVGYNSTTEGSNCEASGSRSHAEGESTTASGNDSHAEGYNSTASNTASHAEGSGTTASGNRAHAEGLSTTASGDYSHAEGTGTTSSATASHSEGSATTASGNYAHAEGLGTIANHVAQHTFGSYNVADTSTAEPSARGNYIEIVGKGTADNARSNARTLDWSGNETLAGGLKINGSDSVIASVYSHADWANSHTFKVTKPATYLLFTDSTIDMAKLKVFPDNVATLYQMIGTNIQSVTLNTSTMEVTVAVNNKGLVAIRII